jgi:hypothetical protein
MRAKAQRAVLQCRADLGQLLELDDTPPHLTGGA